MAEGGQFPWKRQTIDYSRGPPVDYSALQKPLPEPPNGVEWKQDDETRQWRLVRVDDDDKDRRKYKLAVGIAWNERKGRVEPTLLPVPKVKVKDELVSRLDMDDGDDAKVDDQDEASLQGYEGASAVLKSTIKPSPTEKVAVANVDYLVHTVLPTDTLPGLCLRYRTKATILRQLNKFSGSNLHLAPSKLIIPLGPDGQKLLDAGSMRAQDQTTPEYKLQAFLTEFPHLTQSERRAYLEMSDWDLDEAMRSAREDESWERSEVAKRRVREKSSLPLTASTARTLILNVHVAIPVTNMEMADPSVSGSIIGRQNVETELEESDEGLTAPLLIKELELGPLEPSPKVDLKDEPVLLEEIDDEDDARVSPIVSQHRGTPTTTPLVSQHKGTPTTTQLTTMSKGGDDSHESEDMELLLVKELELAQRSPLLMDS